MHIYMNTHVVNLAINMAGMAGCMVAAAGLGEAEG
jgi:hypothetical protein